MVAKKSLASLVTVLTVIAVSYGASLNPTQRRLYDDIVAGRGFYNYNTKITVLNSTNFKDAVFGRNHAWIIEFYNSWCGACQRFASVWKAFAADVYGLYFAVVKAILSFCFQLQGRSTHNLLLNTAKNFLIHDATSELTFSCTQIYQFRLIQPSPSQKALRCP